LAQESWKMELRIERYGSRRYEGQNGLFRRFWGGFVEFLSGWKRWRKRTRVFAKFGNCSRNFGGFLECLERLGHNHNYFWKIEGPLQFHPMCRDHGEIYKKNRGFSAKFMGYKESRIVFQWKIQGPGGMVESMVDQWAAQTMVAAARRQRGV
jgi:hypothetical protein